MGLCAISPLSRLVATELMQNWCWKLGNSIQQEGQQGNYREEQNCCLPQAGIMVVQLVDPQEFLSLWVISQEFKMNRSNCQSELRFMRLHRICKFACLVGST